MKIETWNYKGKEIEVPILEEDEIEKNIDIDLEKTLDLTEELIKLGENNEQ